MTGMPPPPTVITMMPSLISALTVSSSTISFGRGEATTRRQPRPASSTTLQPISVLRRLASASSMNPPIGLVGFLKGRVVAIHQHLGDDRGDVLLDAALEQLVLQRLLQRVADRALRVRAAHVQRNFVHPFDLLRDLGAAQDKTDLRPVAVTDGNVPARFDHVGDVVTRSLWRA